MLDAINRLISAILTSVRTYTWYWVGGAGVVLAGAAALLLFGNLFGPSGQTICEIARFKTVQYGVLGANTVQDGSGKSGKIKGRRECALTVGGDTYVATVDLSCDDLSKEKAEMKAAKDGKPVPTELVNDFNRCISLFAVERTDGLTLYQRKAVPNDVPEDTAKASGDEDEGDNASAQPEPPAAPNTDDLEVAKPAAPQQ